MIRLDRKLGFTSNELMGGSGIGGLIDATIMETFRITDEEYDYLCEHMTDEEMNLFISDSLSFSDKRKLVIMLDVYIKNINEK
jgi:hypothetical protein